MLNKLYEMKSVVEGINFATKMVRERGSTEGHLYAALRCQQNVLEKNALKYLEILLPIVEASMGLGDPLAITDGQTATECVYCGNRIWATVTENQHTEDCPWGVLQNKLKALD